MLNCRTLASDLATKLAAVLKEVGSALELRNGDLNAQAKASVLAWEEFDREIDLDEDGGALDTLIALVERGPLWDGDVPSKRGRDILIMRGLAAKVINNGEDGYQAATYYGAQIYCRRYGASTIKEAMANRKAKN